LLPTTVNTLTSFSICTPHSNVASNMAQANGNADKITLYTNHACPWAHRAHIVLKELGLKYDEVIIDLNTPREPWYLEINPVSSPYLR
jgi:glutathionyl-hydroquinone reductase